MLELMAHNHQLHLQSNKNLRNYVKTLKYSGRWAKVSDNKIHI